MRFHCAALLLAASTLSAFAQGGPEIVIPGKPGVPVYINGIDASWGIVEGQLGLDRPNEAAPTVIWRPYLISIPYRAHDYYPADGRHPGYGRLEITPPPNRRLPPPAPSFYRNWSSESAPGPATEYAPSAPLVYAPSYSRTRSGSHRQGAGKRGP
jgi:hypothetical protein